MKTAIKSYIPAVLVMLMSIPVSQASTTDDTVGSQLIVKTSVAEVIGVREIESGKLEQGIRKSKAALAKTSTVSLRKPLLDNLCVAHLAIKNMEQANQYCQAAVNTGRASAISYNNRAVMHYVLGNFEASLEDLDAANSQGRFQNLVAANLKIVKQQNGLGKHYGLVTEEESSLIAITDR
jgi:tetratricopeptide (TPR) repeat protein